MIYYYRILTILLCIVFCNTALANKIAVINIEKLINENLAFNKLLSDIDLDQKNKKKELDIIQEKLKIKITEIESSKLILNSEEIGKLITQYNDEYKEFMDIVEIFNLHYQNEIIKNKEILLDKIIFLVKDYVKKNSIDLVFDSTTYLVASNSLNITSIIQDNLNNIDITLAFDSFEKN